MNVENIMKNTRAIYNPIDPLNIYLHLMDLFKLQNMKSISGDNFVVRNGILQCQNYFIPLDSISIVEMARIQISPWTSICILLIGLFLSIYNIYLYKEYYVTLNFATPLVFLGFILTFFVIFLNTKLPYTLTIRLNNNIFCTYMNNNKKFIQDIMIKMQECINNRKGEYKFMLNQGTIEYNDNHSINIEGGVGRDFIAPGANKTTYKNSQNEINKQQSKTGMTAEDWMNLEKYFIMRQQEFLIGDRNYKICSNLITYSQRKDAGKIKEYLHKIGKEGIRMLFTASTNVAAMEVVKPIVNKILKG